MSYIIKIRSFMCKRVLVVFLISIALFAIVFVYLLIIFLFPLRHFNLIKKYCVEYNLKPELICSIIHTESKFDQYAVSRRGASGLMQIRKSTADWGAREIGIHNYDYTRIFEANINIQIGCWYIDKLFKQFKNYDLAICAYNAGSGNVSKWIRQMKDANASEIDIPFKETRNYIKRVRKNENIYKVIIHILKK